MKWFAVVALLLFVVPALASTTGASYLRLENGDDMLEYMIGGPYGWRYADCHIEHYNDTIPPIHEEYDARWQIRYAEYEACVAGDEKTESTCLKEWNKWEEPFIVEYSEAIDELAKDAVDCMHNWMPDNEGACDDGVDNDGDGNTDCADPDCNGKNLDGPPTGYDANPACACIAKSYQGDSATKLDILFIGDNVKDFGISDGIPADSILKNDAFYASITQTSIMRNNKFGNSIKKVFDVFRETEPLKASDAKINYWYARPNLYTGESIKSVMRRCSFADNVIIMDYDTSPFIGSHARLDSGYAVVKVNKGGDLVANLAPYVALHEFGHSFAGLLDEYKIGLKGVLQIFVDIFRQRNCCADAANTGMDYTVGLESANQAECETKFKEMVPADKQSTIDLYRGCSYSGWYRSSEHSIMKSNFLAPAGQGKVFNEVSKSIINEKLEAFA